MNLLKITKKSSTHNRSNKNYSFCFTIQTKKSIFFILFYQRKGYLSPNDVTKMFEAFGKKVNLNEIENSFKYAKVHKNKMSFEDFKEYFYNF